MFDQLEEYRQALIQNSLAKKIAEAGQSAMGMMPSLYAQPMEDKKEQKEMNEITIKFKGNGSMWNHPLLNNILENAPSYGPLR